MKKNPVKYVEEMNYKYSNGPKPKADTVAQLNALKSWSQNPAAYEKKLKALPPKKEIKVAGIKDTALYKTLKDPRVIGIDLGTDTIREIINLIQNSGLVKKPRPEPNIPIEEKIRRFAKAKQNDTDQIGVASLLGIPKKFSR
jgi:hypothetical protein